METVAGLFCSVIPQHTDGVQGISASLVRDEHVVLGVESRAVLVLSTLGSLDVEAAPVGPVGCAHLDGGAVEPHPQSLVALVLGANPVTLTVPSVASEAADDVVEHVGIDKLGQVGAHGVAVGLHLVPSASSQKV